MHYLTTDVPLALTVTFLFCILWSGARNRIVHGLALLTGRRLISVEVRLHQSSQIQFERKRPSAWFTMALLQTSPALALSSTKQVRRSLLGAISLSRLAHCRVQLVLRCV